MTISWAKTLGTITSNGNSTTVGLGGSTGGYVGKANSTLSTDGYHYQFVGNIQVGAIGMWAWSGSVIADYLSTGAHPLAAQLATSRSAILILAIGWNDICLSDGTYTQAQHRAALEALLTEVYASTPWIRVIVTQMLPCEAGDARAWPTADLTACNAFISTWNTTTMPAMVAAQVALGRLVYACGSIAQPVVRDAGHIHPVDGATGYDKMAVPVVAALEALAP